MLDVARTRLAAVSGAGVAGCHWSRLMGLRSRRTTAPRSGKPRYPIWRGRDMSELIGFADRAPPGEGAAKRGVRRLGA
jgi:hypothetical protein